jgi:hypothetical protein
MERASVRKPASLINGHVWWRAREAVNSDDETPYITRRIATEGVRHGGERNGRRHAIALRWALR